MSRHSLRQAQRALHVLDDGRRLDGRSVAAKFLQAFQNELCASLGGADVLSHQELTIIRVAARTALLLSQVDEFLAVTPAINRSKRALIPLAVQRGVLAGQLLDQLKALGLQRRAKSLPTLRDYVAGVTVEQRP